MWVTFAKAMVPFMAPVTHGVVAEVTKWPTAPKRILDVAAGHGMFGITLAQVLPRAQVTAIDWPQVLAVARENAQTAGVADRYEIVPGNAFEVGWGAGRDLVLLANFLHHFDHETCVSLPRKARSSLLLAGTCSRSSSSRTKIESLRHSQPCSRS
jgi:2-polyprenyl-3-methyl-5-hydroxy-6-metoxy-1,4-benzoquinol methylase